MTQLDRLIADNSLHCYLAEYIGDEMVNERKVIQHRNEGLNSGHPYLAKVNIPKAHCILEKCFATEESAWAFVTQRAPHRFPTATWGAVFKMHGSIRYAGEEKQSFDYYCPVNFCEY